MSGVLAGIGGRSAADGRGAPGRQRLHAAGWLLLWLGVFLCCWGISIRIPAFQSPDENAHMGRAYLISRGHILLEQPEGRDSGGYFEPVLLRFLHAHDPMIGRAEVKSMPDDVRARMKELRWDPPGAAGTSYYELAGTGYYLPLIYAPQAAGLAIGRALDMTVLHSYRLARALSWLSVIAVLAFACRVLPPNALQAALLLLPMSIFQTVSPVIDGISAALAVLAIALFLRGSDRTQAPVPAWHAWALGATLLMLCTSRNHTMPLLSLPFFLAWQRRSRRDLIVGIVISLAAVGWTLFALKTTLDTRIPREFTTGQLIRRYVGHPDQFFQIVYATLTDPAIWDYYTKLFIGILGWLDTPLPLASYPRLWWGLGACAALSVSVATIRHDGWARLWLLVLAAGSILLIFFALLVTWTPHPAVHVQGVQGRYFLIPLLIAAAALSGTRNLWRPWWRSAPAVAAFAALSLATLIPTLQARYH